MIYILPIKLFVVTAVTAGFFTGGGFLVKHIVSVIHKSRAIEEQTGVPTMSVFGFSQETLSSDQPKNEIDITEGKKNYRCQIEPNKPFDCDISKLNLGTSAKKSSIEELSSNKSTQSITNSVLGAKNNIYKIYAKSEDLGALSPTNKKIEIISRTEPGKKYASIHSTFAIRGDKKPEGMAEYLIGKTTSAIPTFEESSLTCKLFSESNVEAGKKCKIRALSDESNLNSVDFKWPVDKVTSITPNQYYIFEIPGKYDMSKLGQVEISYKATASSSGNAEKTTLKEVKPVFFSNAEKFMFVLK